MIIHVRLTVFAIPTVLHRHVEIDGVQVFYRETVPQVPDAPTLLFLHGFPSGSHHCAPLQPMDALGARYRMIAPDYPGFGHSDAPKPASLGGPFIYSFDNLAHLVACKGRMESPQKLE